MNRTRITEALRVAEADGTVRGSDRLQLMMLVAKGSTASVSELLTSLKEDTDLDRFHDKYQICPGRCGLVDCKFLATWLILRARRVGADQAVADVERYLTADTVPFSLVVVLAGIEVPDPYPLAGGVQIIPWRDVSPSHWKEKLDESESDAMMYPFYRPTSALLRWQDVKVFHETVPRTQLIQSLPEQDLRDALLCMGLVGPAAPVVVATWTEAAEWAPVDIPGSSHGYPGRVIDTTYTAADLQRLKALHEGFLALTDNVRRHYRIPLERLNSARRRTTTVDSAIDLGIALESVFLQDLEDDRGELTFRLRTRAARFLSADVEKRRDLFQFFGDLYRLRSKAVHTGDLPVTHEGTDTQLILDRGCELVARAIERVIVSGPPDWFDVLLS